MIQMPAIQLPARALKSAGRRLLHGLGYEISRAPSNSSLTAYESVTPRADYAPWNADTSFLEAYRKIAAHTLVDKYRCYELGVWRGGTGSLIALRAQLCGIRDRVYLCDTFCGVVKAGRQDQSYAGGEHSDTSRAMPVKSRRGPTPISLTAK